MPEPIAKIAVIGGSGLYQLPEITDLAALEVDTPFGKPSGDIIVGSLRGKRVAFIPRHGRGHVFTPSTAPYAANIFALKTLGVRHIIAVNACGSLREELPPGHIVVPDQLFDHTKHNRIRSFFDTGLVAHVSVADPFSPELSQLAAAAVARAGGSVRLGGVFVTIEGPRFSTRGESQIFRQLGCDIIGMTTAPEAFLAREAEIAYVCMAHVTDYDVWHQSEAPVTVDMVVQQMQRNLELAQLALANLVESIDENADYAAHHSLDYALMTDRAKADPAVVERLRPIIGRLFA